MTVQELNADQLNELREAYYFQLVETGEDYELSNSDEISNDILFNHYEGITFVNDDFFCSSGE